MVCSSSCRRVPPGRLRAASARTQRQYVATASFTRAGSSPSSIGTSSGSALPRSRDGQPGRRYNTESETNITVVRLQSVCLKGLDDSGAPTVRPSVRRFNDCIFSRLRPTICTSPHRTTGHAHGPRRGSRHALYSFNPPLPAPGPSMSKCELSRAQRGGLYT